MTAYVEREVGPAEVAKSESLSEPGGKLALETARRRRERVLGEIGQWLDSYPQEHHAIWDDPIVFRQAVKELANISRIETDEQFEALKQIVTKETDALAAPFKDMRYEAIPEKQRKLAAVAVAALEGIMAVQTLPRDSAFTIKGSFVDVKDQPVRRVKVNQPVFLTFTPSQSAYVTPVQFDERTLIVLKLDKNWPAGDTAILKNDFSFATPGKKRVALYATDEPIFKDLPFIDANLYAFLALEKREEFAGMFAGKFTHDRILWSLELGTPLVGAPSTQTVRRWTRDLVDLTVEP